MFLGILVSGISSDKLCQGGWVDGLSFGLLDLGYGVLSFWVWGFWVWVVEFLNFAFLGILFSGFWS